MNQRAILVVAALAAGSPWQQSVHGLRDTENAPQRHGNTEYL